MSFNGEQVRSSPETRVMMFRKTICLMEVAARLLWAMSGFHVEQDTLQWEGVHGMLQLFKCHERSFSCMYGVANVLRGIMMQEFPMLRGTWNGENATNLICFAEKGVHWDSLLRVFSPGTGKRQDVLQAHLVDAPAENCME